VRIGIQAWINHDAVNEIIDHRRDGIDPQADDKA
jgi:hypothetical protein